MSEDRSLEAFTRAYLDYRPTLYGMVAKIMGGRHDEIEDVLQDVWIRVSRVWLREPIRYPKSYLGRAAITSALMRRRGKWIKRYDGSVEVEKLLEQVPDAAPGPEALLETGIEAETLAAAIQELPPKYGDALYLHLYHGLSCPEVARALQRSEGWAKTTVWRAIQLLKERLGPEPAVE